MFYWDNLSAKAVAIHNRLADLQSDHPNVLIVLGGDGTMLRAIRENWRLRLPFFGINCGHVGHLLNDIPRVLGVSDVAAISDASIPISLNFKDKEVLLHHLPLLCVDYIDEKGRLKHDVSFNDAWVERGTGQTCWVEVRVNNEVKIPKLVSDGLLISTAAGSTAYAHAMGAPSVPVGCPVICMVGSNVAYPLSWKCVYLPLDVKVEVTTLDSSKRPTRGFVDGVDIGLVSKMKVRVSTIADCRLAFLKTDDMIRKLGRLQFPDEKGF